MKTMKKTKGKPMYKKGGKTKSTGTATVDGDNYKVKVTTREKKRPYGGTKTVETIKGDKKEIGNPIGRKTTVSKTNPDGTVKSTKTKTTYRSVSDREKNLGKQFKKEDIMKSGGVTRKKEKAIAAKKSAVEAGKPKKIAQADKKINKYTEEEFMRMKKGGAAKSKVSKMKDGGEQETYASRKRKTVTKSPDKNYKTKVKEKMGPSGTSAKVVNRRTVKGVVSGASKMKKGGVSKKK
jgi:hypothetical protein